jgi:hypothetical protein
MLLRNFVVSVASHVQVWRSFLSQPPMTYININWHGWWATIVVLWTKGTETWTTYVYSGLRTHDVFIAIVAFNLRQHYVSNVCHQFVNYVWSCL